MREAGRPASSGRDHTPREPRPGGRAAAGPSALRLEGVTKRFPGVLANDRISLEIKRGEIHGLLGENGAGKSTLMNVVFGLCEPDEGRIEVDGAPIRIRNPRQAMDAGIGMVHQHFKLIPDMTVAENVALTPSLLPRKSKLSDIGERIGELSRRFGLAVDPEATIERLTLGEQQRVEIVKMLYGGARVLILDEPTAALTPPEWIELAGFLRSLTQQGSSVVLITHKLDELFGVADRCTVLRDGRVVDTLEMAVTDKPALARMMVGRDVNLRAERIHCEPGRSVLEVDDLTLVDGGRMLLDEISFEVREREVLGVAGVSGNGQVDLIEALVGLRGPTSGSIRIGGELLGDGPRGFMAAGGAVIPENRHRDGISSELSLQDNLMLKELGHPPYSRRGIIDQAAVDGRCASLVAEYDIRTPSLSTRIGQLSGGNQQKAVLARELGRHPSLLIAAQPTRGLDVGAIEFVYARLADQKRRGAAILLLSIELDEILSLSDRIAVMVGGRILRILDNADADPERIGLLMGGEEVQG